MGKRQVIWTISPKIIVVALSHIGSMQLTHQVIKFAHEHVNTPSTLFSKLPHLGDMENELHKRKITSSLVRECRRTKNKQKT